MSIRDEMHPLIISSGQEEKKKQRVVWAKNTFNDHRMTWWHTNDLRPLGTSPRPFVLTSTPIKSHVPVEINSSPFVLHF